MNEDKVNIGIWGKGIVGSATGMLFEESDKTKVYYYDKYKNIGSKIDVVDSCDFIFLCLPTPMKVNGEICLDYLETTIAEIDKLTEKKKIIIIRSTAVSGSTDKFADKYTKFDFVFCPEFLTEKNAEEDMKLAGRIVIGANSDTTFEAVKSIFKYAYNDKVTYIRLTRKEAETLKYISNIFLAGQVMLANELYFICDKLNVNYNKLREQLKYDGRIGSHTQVPGPDGDYGIGGKCFPKDVSAFIYLSKQNGIEPRILEEMMRLNEKVRINKDWLDIAGACESNKKFKTGD